jgi:hypothetical protein
LRDGGYLLKDVLCEYFEEKNEAGEVIKRGWRPKVNPKARRFIHIDPAISGDAAGFVMGHVSRYEERKRIRVVQIIDVVTGEKKPIREPYSETLPVIWIDLILRIVPPPGGEIILNDVRQLVYDLRSLGFRIGLITKDTYQSKDMEQILIEKGYKVEDLSVDANIEPYNRLKMALYESRVIAYEHPTLTGELKGLEKNKKKGKVDHRPHGCFTGDTRIALLDGTLPTFEDLFRRFGEGQVFYVYTISDGSITVGEAHNPRITGTGVKVLEVTLDNFQVIKCTADHLFMLIDGSYVKAENLTIEMRLMPLYRTRTQKGGWLEYEKYFDPINRRGDLLTHHMVARWKFGEIPEGMIVHHCDGCRGNNDPSNLELENRVEHARKHTAKRHESDKDWVGALRKGHEAYRISGGNEKSRENIIKLFNEGKLKRGRQICCIEGCDNLVDAKGMCGKHYQFFKRERLRVQNHRGNHRVLSIEEGVYTDVWDITVEKTHNFALASGVFVHNSKDVADGLAGVIYNCETRIIAEPVAPSLGDVESPADDEAKRREAEFRWLLGQLPPKDGGDKKEE